MPIILLHVVIILMAYSSPIWLDWKLVILGAALYYVQLLIFGWCVLSLKQFHGKKQTFHEWYLAKLSIKLDPIKLRFVLNYVLPGVLVLLALFVQVGLKIQPVVKLPI